jgi:hypothetical protein
MNAPLVKFKTVGWGKGLIEPVECERETDLCVWVARFKGSKPTRQAKISGYDCYHDTWELAHEYLMKKAQRAVDHARHILESENGKLGNIKGMKPPKESV